MPTRPAILPGRFYAAEPDMLRQQIMQWMPPAKEKREAFMIMLPHAGHAFCGHIIGATLKDIHLPDRIIILCPNHTGNGHPLGVWPSGQWETPLGSVSIDTALATELIDGNAGFQADTFSHAKEHSIEVLLPFFQIAAPQSQIVPVCVGTQNLTHLRAAAQAIAHSWKKENMENKPFLLVISSDMNHFESEDITHTKDNLALEQVMQMDAQSLLELTSKEKISMCGRAAMALGILTAQLCRPVSPNMTLHDTSARLTGDTQRVVGYAGMHFF